MSTDYEFQLMQLSDSFFPSGMFSMSGGLESLVINEKIDSPQDVLDFINEQIEFQLIPSDCMVLEIAMNCIKNDNFIDIIEIDKKYFSLKLSKEIRNSSVRSGKQMFNCLNHMTKGFENHQEFLEQFKNKIESKETPCTYPVVLGITAEILKIPIQSVKKILLYSYAASVVSAAIRLGVIQHLDAQKILLLLGETIKESVSKSENLDIKKIWQLTPLMEINQMNHEHYENRMFIT